MQRFSFLTLASAGALASCAGAATSPLVTPMRALLRPRSSCVPDVQYDPKSGVLWCYGCATSGLAAGGTASFYTTPYGDFKFRFLPFDGSVPPFFLDLNNPAWNNQARLIKIYSRWISTADYVNNHAAYLSQDQSHALSDAAFNPDYDTVTCHQFQPAPQQTYQSSYVPNLRHAVQPATCHSSKLIFAAASMSAMIGLCTVEFGIGFVAIAVAGMLAIAGSGEDMLAQCKR